MLILAWYVFTLLARADGTFAVLLMPFQLYGGPSAHVGALVLTTIMTCFVPIVCLLKIASIFLRGRLPAFAAFTHPVQILLSILSSFFVASLIVIQVIVFARNGSYFLAFSPFVYAVFLVSVCYNAYFISLLIASLNAG